MPRLIRPITPAYRQAALELVERVFTAWRDDQEGRMVRRLVRDIRRGPTYVPELELIALEDGALAGYAMFSRFSLAGQRNDRLLLLTPVAVETALQRRHISKDLLEFGFAQALALGFDAVLVEGDPANYRPRGFVTAAAQGIVPGQTVRLPSLDCLMVKALRPGALETLAGTVEYTAYPALLASEKEGDAP